MLTNNPESMSTVENACSLVLNHRFTTGVLEYCEDSPVPSRNSELSLPNTRIYLSCVVVRSVCAMVVRLSILR
jgi:hypothetical protein